MELLLVAVISIAFTVSAEKCGFPGSPRNGNISVYPNKDVYEEGEKVNYACKQNFTISHHEARVCRDNGSWSASIPFCFKRYNLESLSLIYNHPEEERDYSKTGQWRTVKKYEIPNDHPGAKVRRVTLQTVQGNQTAVVIEVGPKNGESYGCDNQEYLYDRKHRHWCPENQESFNETVIIVKMKNYVFNISTLLVDKKYAWDCGEPERPFNAKVRGNDSRARYTCKKGYISVGNDLRSCQIDGTWDGELPSCIDDVDSLTHTIKWDNITTKEITEVGNFLETLSNRTLEPSVVASLANLTDKLLEVPASVILESKISIPKYLESLLSNVDMQGAPEIREKKENIEINMWNISTIQQVPLVCGTPDFSSPSVTFSNMSQCPDNLSEYSVRFLDQVTEGVVILSVFKGQSLFPVGDYSYDYVVQAKIRSDLQPKNENAPHIDIRFKRPTSSGEVSCSFLDFSISPTSLGTWSTEECSSYFSDDTSVTCQYNHFTYFAALFHAPVTAAQAKVLHITTTIGLSASIVSLFLTFFTYLILPNLRSHINHILFNLCVAMLFMNFLFVVNIEKVEENVKCYFTAFTLHVSTLATFTWLLMLTFVVAITVGKGTAAISVIDKYFKRTAVMCWLFPILIAMFTATIDHSMYTSNPEVCWLTEKGLIYAFLPFYGLLTAANFLLWFAIWVKVGHFAKLKANNPEIVKRFAFQICMSFLVFVFTNLMWIVGVGAYISQNTTLSFFFCIVAPLQGVFIFLFFVYMDSKGSMVWSAVIGVIKFRCLGKPAIKGASIKDTHSSYISGI